MLGRGGAPRAASRVGRPGSGEAPSSLRGHVGWGARTAAPTARASLPGNRSGFSAIVVPASGYDNAPAPGRARERLGPGESARGVGGHLAPTTEPVRRPLSGAQRSRYTGPATVAKKTRRGF